jgi:two-component system phosphate regulon sensor histidine kinase PhoR
MCSMPPSVFAPTASGEKGIDVQFSCEPDLNGCFDATLLEQAAVNLLDNAIKYSPEKSAIHIEAQ